jgi:hypothetical protein
MPRTGLKIAFVSIVTAAVGLLAMPVRAATPQQIEQSISDGLAWLATQQNANGSFGSYYPIGETGLAVWKLCDRARELGMDPLSTGYVYHTKVQDGLNYLFGQATVVALSAVDGNLDGQAVLWGGDSTYLNALSLSAIAACQNRDTLVTVSGPLNGWTHSHVAQDALDWLLYGQGDGGCAEGGWGYAANFTNWSDQSNTGYVTFGLKLASDPPPYGFGLTIPAIYRTRLNTYIGAVQDPVDGSADGYDGGSWYEPCGPYKWVNILKTGHLLAEMALVGDTSAAQRVKNAITYIQNHWNSTGPQPEFTSTSLGWKDSYQAMFTMMKGLTLMGINTLNVGGSIDWFDQVSTQIVTTQNANGSWPLTFYEGGDASQILTTAWALLVLEKAVGKAPTQQATQAPAMSAVSLFVLAGLLTVGGVWVIRRRASRARVRAHVG